MAKKNPPPTEPERPRIKRSKEEAKELIARQVDKGENLVSSAIPPIPPESAKEFAERLKFWKNYTSELLRSLFTTGALAREFDPYPSNAWDMNANRYLQNLKLEHDRNLVNLRSILQRIDLFEELPIDLRLTEARDVNRPATASRDVFVVHGRDDAAKESVARFLERLDLHPIILHEQADKGRTVIEKFEDHSNVCFAVVLLTADDEGRLRGSEQLELRARQNVILEFGFFIGKLGRERVCALKTPGVDEPSDIRGVLYIPLDNGGAWRLKLAAELKAANIDVDLNCAV